MEIYLNIGADVLLDPRQIIGIFDLDTANTQSDTKALLKKAEKNKKMYLAGYELPKSFVLLEDGGVYMSQFSASVLKDKTRQLRGTPKDAVKKASSQLKKVKKKTKTI